MTTPISSWTTAWRLRAVVPLALAALALGVAVWRLQAQETLTPGFRTYSLRHTSAAELAPQVRQALTHAAGKPEIVIDKQSNSLLIRGGDDAHRLASQAIETLDRPASTPARAVPDARAETSLRGYKLPPGDADKLLSDLKRRYPPSTGASIAIDKRTGQLLVIAAPDVHRKLAEQFEAAGSGESTTRQPQLGAAQNAKPEEQVAREHALKNISWQGLEDLLRRVWSSKASVETQRSGEVASIRMRNTLGQEAVARIDRRRNEVTFEGSRTNAAQWAKLVSVLDSGPAPKDEAVQLVPVSQADPEQLHNAIGLIKQAMQQPALQAGEARAAQTLPGGERRSVQATDLVARIFQQPGQQPEEEQNPNQPDNQQPPVAPPPAPADELGGPIGPVRIEFLEGLDVVIVTGNKRDVARVTKIIQDIQNISQETQPIIEIYMLRNVDSTAVGDLVVQLYNEALSARFGRVSVTSLDKPNALLFIGRRDSIDAVLELVKKLDQPVSPQTQFQVFQLRHMASAEALRIVQEFFANRGALGIQVLVSSDTRTNSLIVHASQRDLAEVKQLLTSIDVVDIPSKSEVRIFQLKNALADDLVPVLQQAIGGSGGTTTTQPGQPPQPAPAGGTSGGTQRQSTVSLWTVDAEGNRVLESALLSDVTVTADSNANAVIVRGPVNSMDLIEALIRELDRLPQSEAQIKVFTIVNGDATALATMLQTLFGQQTGGAGGQFGAGGFFGQPVTAGGDNSLVPLRFSVDQRTNSILATGSPGDLSVVEAILARLDEGDIRQRKTTVYRLKNAPAIDVANAVNQFLTSQRQIQQLAPTATSPYEQLEREVVVVPEAVSNSLIVSATPRFYDEIARVVEELDARPPMVMIQVLIAEVSLNDFEEFGAEFGLQDSLLFDRSVINNAVGAPGYAFNNAPPANIGSNPALSNDLAGQALSHFSVGRQNGSLGYGGLVLSASNESISILIRALQDAQRLQVLSRPQVMTLDNQSAFVQVGQRVPRITSVQTGNITQGNVNSIELDNVGLLMGVTPRISPDGLVVMEIDAEKSELGPIEQGIPVSFGPNGEVIRQPIINTTLAQTTVSARSGQTVILGGLITKSRGYSSRRVPYLSDIPVLGRLFRYDSSSEERTELLIIMTPHIVKTEADGEWIKQVESDRMSWCLADVVEIHGDAGLSGGNGLWGPATAPPIYPDVDPTGLGHEFVVPDGELPPLRRYPTTPSGMTPGAATPTLLNPPLPQSTVSPQQLPSPTPPAADQSSRRKALQPPATAAATPGTHLPQQPLRVEKSDNATVFYAEPKPRPLPTASHAAGAAEIAPAVYDQTQSRLASPYPVQPMTWQQSQGR